MKPCNFDHNGECLICDCWPSDCAYVRWLNKDFTYETEEPLREMFKNWPDSSVGQNASLIRRGSVVRVHFRLPPKGRLSIFLGQPFLRVGPFMVRQLSWQSTGLKIRGSPVRFRSLPLVQGDRLYFFEITEPPVLRRALIFLLSSVGQSVWLRTTRSRVRLLEGKRRYPLPYSSFKTIWHIARCFYIGLFKCSPSARD